MNLVTLWNVAKLMQQLGSQYFYPSFEAILLKSSTKEDISGQMSI